MEGVEAAGASLPGPEWVEAEEWGDEGEWSAGMEAEEEIERAMEAAERRWEGWVRGDG